MHQIFKVKILAFSTLEIGNVNKLTTYFLTFKGKEDVFFYIENNANAVYMYLVKDPNILKMFISTNIYM